MDNVSRLHEYPDLIHVFMFFSEAVRKQHEAMSRAIMLAGDRSNNNRPTVTTSAKSTAAAEKRVIGLESERGVLKQMLTATQKERDELMKEVHRLHSQGELLFSDVGHYLEKQFLYFIFTEGRSKIDKSNLSGS